jgi:hypothetical protein
LLRSRESDKKHRSKQKGSNFKIPWQQCATLYKVTLAYGLVIKEIFAQQRIVQSIMWRSHWAFVRSLE